jgi:hypothetical protein
MENIELEIKKIKRVQLKIIFLMDSILDLLYIKFNDDTDIEKESLLKKLSKLDMEIKTNNIEIVCSCCDDIINVKNDVKYLMKRQKEREDRMKKYFTYYSSNSE